MSLLPEQYSVGLVVGKFSPLHVGHEYLLKTAAQRCERLIIISYSNPVYPGCDALERRRWLTQFMCQLDSRRNDSIFVLPDVPAVLNDDPDYVHRKLCANICKEKFGVQPDFVFTSEAYGDGFVEVINNVFGTTKTKHICVDMNRSKHSISATSVRSHAQIWKNPWISKEVATSFVPKVVFLGGESSGKTTMASAVAEYFNVPVVYEYGRELWELRKGTLSSEDYLLICKEQVRRERIAQRQAFDRGDDFISCDTSPLTTYWYAQQEQGTNVSLLLPYLRRHYDYVFLCDSNIPFDQDGTRRDEQFRQAGFDWYSNKLTLAQQPFTVISGSVTERLQQVLTVVQS